MRGVNMDQKNNTDISGQVGGMGKPGHGKKKMLIMLVVVVFVLSLFGGAGWYYFDASKKADDQKARISELEGRVSDLLARLTDAGLEVPDVVPDVDGDCSGGSSYSADIGNFGITLSDPNVVIRSLDGGFEGGPITSLNIGQCADGLDNVVDSTPTTEVKITAHPAATSAELKTIYESTLGSALVADSTMMIDGVSADVYTFSGLFDVKVVYFDNAGIGYEIALSATNATTEAILTDLTADWNFTP